MIFRKRRLDPERLMGTNWAQKAFRSGLFCVIWCVVWIGITLFVFDWAWWANVIYILFMGGLAAYTGSHLRQNYRNAKAFPVRQARMQEGREMFIERMITAGIPRETANYIDHLALEGHFLQAEDLLARALEVARRNMY